MKHSFYLYIQAYKAGFYGKKIVWFFVNWFQEKFWEHSFNKTGCTLEQMRAAAEGIFYTGFNYIHEPRDEIVLPYINMSGRGIRGNRFFF